MGEKASTKSTRRNTCSCSARTHECCNVGFINAGFQRHKVILCQVAQRDVVRVWQRVSVVFNAVCGEVLHLCQRHPVLAEGVAAIGASALPAKHHLCTVLPIHVGGFTRRIVIPPPSRFSLRVELRPSHMQARKQPIVPHPTDLATSPEQRTSAHTHTQTHTNTHTHTQTYTSNCIATRAYIRLHSQYLYPSQCTVHCTVLVS